MASVIFFNDDEFGKVSVELDGRLRSVKLWVASEGLMARCPGEDFIGDIKRLIEKNRERIRDGIKKEEENRKRKIFFTSSFKYEHELYTIYICPLSQKKTPRVGEDGKLYYPIYYAKSEDLNDERVQSALMLRFDEALRRIGRFILPPMLDEISKKNGLSYASLKVNKSRSRYGSCSSRKSINISIITLRLPTHLIRYILCHELAHTIEMNHSDRFWRLVEKIYGAPLDSIRRELKEVR